MIGILLLNNHGSFYIAFRADLKSSSGLRSAFLVNLPEPDVHALNRSRVLTGSTQSTDLLRQYSWLFGSAEHFSRDLDLPGIPSLVI